MLSVLPEIELDSSLELEIIYVQPDTECDKLRMKSLSGQGRYNESLIQVEVELGFSDQQREEFLTRRNFLIGQRIEVTVESVTKNQDGVYSFQNPRFKCFCGVIEQERNKPITKDI